MHEIYKLALENEAAKKYVDANRHLSDVINFLDESGLKQTEQYSKILKKMVSNYNNAGSYSESENILKNRINSFRKGNVAPHVLYGAYYSLFSLYLYTNIKEAILLGKALLSENERQMIPVDLEREFQLNLGTAYLLKGNYEDAKTRLKGLLRNSESISNRDLVGRAMNNLAVACWWHKHPNFNNDYERDYNAVENESKSDKIRKFSEIDKDFQQCLKNFKVSLYELEGLKTLADSENKKKLLSLLSQKVQPNVYSQCNPQYNLLFQSPHSGKVLINIFEWTICNSPNQMKESMFWFYTAMRYYKERDPANIHKCLICLGVSLKWRKDYKEAQKILKFVSTQLEGTNNYLQVLALESLGRMFISYFPERHDEGIRILQEASKRAQKMPRWWNKLAHVILPDINV